MKKIIAIIFLFIVTPVMDYAQDLNAESEWHENILHDLDTARQDTSRVLLIAELASYYKFHLPDSALFYAYKALALARQIKFPKGELAALRNIAVIQTVLGNDSRGLQIILLGLKIAEKNNLVNDRASFIGGLGIIYTGIKNYKKALDLLRESKALSDSLHDLAGSTASQNFIGQIYIMMNQPDSALYYCQSAYENATRLDETWLMQFALLNLGRIQQKKGNIDLALTYLRQSLSMAYDLNTIFDSYFSIAQLYQEINKPDSSIYYTKKSLEIIQGKGFYSNIVDANLLLSGIYERSDPRKALEYSNIAIAYKDSLHNLGRTTSFENFTAYDEQERQYEIETAKTAYQNQVRQYVLIAGLLVFLLLAFILYRNNRNKQKAKLKIEKAYEELKSTQSQLVQREKMASLGELTAGIAHEIQNPLNFVNNFSEVNTELIDELQSELQAGNTDDVFAISNDIKDNEQKILQHGRRADAIVKGMLQHSRISTGQKEQTDLNKLADEYLRLSYHGLRAKDKGFNATLQTDFDASIGKINIVPQDIGRVLLNLFNNAFYAVQQKENLSGFENLSGLNNYERIVSVSTKRINSPTTDGAGGIEIRVKDNGIGIPQKVVDKIFQPFFTTKPTGEGTGLGLSLSYDIIKAHGGEIKVETKEGEGSEFVIALPVY
jgi:two-component system NtrC family sensor kinase